MVSSDGGKNLPLKCADISRHVIFSLTILLTLLAIGYAIYIPVVCNEEVSGKDCPLGKGKDICSQSLNPIISLSISAIIIGCLLVGVRYTWFLVALAMSIGLQVLYIIPFSINDNPSHLTVRSDETVLKEMSRCPLTSNSSQTSDSQCWQRFRDLFCQDWIMAENRICRTFGAECESKNQTWCFGPEYDYYRNLTPKHLIGNCVEKYEPWVFGTHKHYYDRAFYLLLSITGIHLVLFCLMSLSVYYYKHLSSEDTESSVDVSSGGATIVSSTYRNTLYS